MRKLRKKRFSAVPSWASEIKWHWGDWTGSNMRYKEDTTDQKCTEYLLYIWMSWLTLQWVWATWLCVVFDYICPIKLPGMVFFCSLLPNIFQVWELIFFPHGSTPKKISFTPLSVDVTTNCYLLCSDGKQCSIKQNHLRHQIELHFTSGST